MDSIDNPDHGRRVYTASGITVVDKPFDPAKASHDPTPSPSGGPVFPATSDVAISSTPT